MSSALVSGRTRITSSTIRCRDGCRIEDGAAGGGAGRGVEPAAQEPVVVTAVRFAASSKRGTSNWLRSLAGHAPDCLFLADASPPATMSTAVFTAAAAVRLADRVCRMKRPAVLDCELDVLDVPEVVLETLREVG